jgi:hypothetical protein
MHRSTSIYPCRNSEKKSMIGEIPLSDFANAMSKITASDTEPMLTDQLLIQLTNGHATKFVYDILSANDRKKDGIFFSGSSWASKLFSKLDISKWQRFIDPSVGTGDLLLEICKTIPLKNNLDDTLDDWADRLIAIDLRKSFLEIAWMRIQAMAMYRHKSEHAQEFRWRFRSLPPTFSVGDTLRTKLDLQPNDCVIMNPPYQRILAPNGFFTGTGKRSAAALHLEHVIKQAPSGVGVYALIPDVLRSGSSYARFRKEVSIRSNVLSFESFGAFGVHADVDVAILVAIVGANEKLEQVSIEAGEKASVVGDFFEISVGTVVPHRTPKHGALHGFLTAKNVAIASEVEQPADFANYTSRKNKGPFVVVRRTSSPSDRIRAKASLIVPREEFLVENHLLVLTPRDSSVHTCRRLLSILNDTSTNNWLNAYIRCRHLTVNAMKLLPWI